MYAGYVEPDIDCHCWGEGGPIDWSGNGLNVTDCWNWGGICEFDEGAEFVVVNASIANADANSVANVDVDANDCCW